MQMTAESLGQFRRKRLLIATLVTFLVLSLALVFRFFAEKKSIEQQSQQFAEVAVQRFDRMFSPLDVTADHSLSIIGQDCRQAQTKLIERLASLQIIRSSALVDNDRIYCSSIFGETDKSLSTTWPHLNATQRMLLTHDKHLLKGSPVLLLWTAHHQNPHSGVLQMINIELLINYLLEPNLPWIERVVFTVDGNSMEYGNPLIEPVFPAEDQSSLEAHSLRYPFSITLLGPPSTHIALMRLPSQLPLALMLSLLMGYIVWLAIANRMSPSWQISNGISGREFIVYCQPLINARTGQCDGIELLLRWNNPRQGWIPPDVFIPLAEQQNVIAPLTRFVLSETVRCLPVLPAHAGFHVAINISASHFRDQEIITDLKNIWWPAQPKLQLIVELTERDALPAVDQQVVTLLHDAGVKLAIDDFGTGHSSLSYLKTLNPDVLKIDKVFTAAIGTDAINATVTDMVISLAQRLNIALIAEGVETAEQAEYLRERGVDVLQGYHYARPMPLDDFPFWLKQQQKISSGR